MEKMNFEVVTFDLEMLPDNSHGASFPALSEYLNKMQIVPTVGMEIGVEDDRLTDENPAIDSYKAPEDYVIVTNVVLRPWRDEIGVIVKFRT